MDAIAWIKRSYLQTESGTSSLGTATTPSRHRLEVSELMVRDYACGYEALNIDATDAEPAYVLETRSEAGSTAQSVRAISIAAAA